MTSEDPRPDPVDGPDASGGAAGATATLVSSDATPTSTPWVNRTLLGVAAVASAAAGLVHGAAAGSHASDRTLAMTFALCAAAQLGWAALAFAAPSRRLAVVGIALNGAAAGAWVASRTVGLPLVESLKGVEEAGTQDALAAVLAGLAVAFAAAAVVPAVARRPLSPTWLAIPAVGMVLLAVPAMAADHSHSHGADGAHAHGAGESADGHAHAGGAAAGHGHAEGESADGHAHDDSPIISVDDVRLTSDQKARATDLIDTTKAAMAKFPDVASVEAAGYTSIGDAMTGFEHYVNQSYMNDGKELDPEAIESVVFKVEGSNRVPSSAMYILERGKTMDDVPDVAGSLTTWHDHQNLCWDESFKRLRGILVNGKCVPGGTLGPTPPMLHVWLAPQACGPFAGLEGHGAAASEGSSPVAKLLAAGNGGATQPATNPDGSPNCSHSHGAEGAADHGGGHGAAGGGHDHGPLPAHLDHDPTDAQKAEARKLLDDTKRETARFADVAVAEAEGYRSIGDGRTGTEHFVHAGYLGDTVVLDPKAPESLVYKVNADGSKTYVTAMYILPNGWTMDDVPDIAGRLTQWHDHQNLCFNPATGRLTGLANNGACRPPGVLRPTAPMLHVWVTENECGPFAGTDTGQMTGSCVKDPGL